MSMTPYSDEFMEAKVNNIYRGDPNLGGSGVFVNLTIKVSWKCPNIWSQSDEFTNISKHSYSWMKA